jgi:predicted RNA methylase
MVQRIAKKAVTLWTVAPLYADFAQARLSRAVPTILHADRRASPRNVKDGTELASNSLGVFLARAGVPVELQQRFSASYPGPGRWDPARPQPRDRVTCLAALKTVVDATFNEQLGQMLQDLHDGGIAAGEVGYGDIVVKGGKPALRNLTGAPFHAPSSLRFLGERERDRDRFNFLFGTELLSEQVFRSRVAALAARRADLLYAPVYHGHGYGVGPIFNIEVGSGKWRFIRRHLPDVRGKRVLDLGTNNAMIPLEMMRAGARSVTGYEMDPVFADYARLNRRWFEFVDNRSYDLELVERPMHAAVESDLSGYDIATSFCSLYYEPPETMARMTRALSGAVEYFVVQANENKLQHTGELARLASLDFLRQLLAENGFSEQRVVRFPNYDRPLVIGRSHRHHRKHQAARPSDTATRD